MALSPVASISYVSYSSPSYPEPLENCVWGGGAFIKDSVFKVIEDL